MSNGQWLAVSLVGVWLVLHWAYAGIMAAKTALEEGKLTLYWKVNLLPFALLGLLLDLVFNYTFGWMFGAVPRPVLFSSTVQYHYRHSDGWRKGLAAFFARNLNVFDPTHIRP